MNCDQAFDCLTDSSRRHSPQLAEHLARCARCREMEATLEPALDLFDELVPEPDLGGNTATRTIAPDSVRVAEQAASRLRAASAQSPIHRRNLVFRYAAAAMVGAALMGLMGSINQANSPAEASKCTWRNRSIDRGEFATNLEFARACVTCHQRSESPIDDGAEPISIEDSPELTAAVDNLVRALWVRHHSWTERAIVVGPRVRTCSDAVCSASATASVDLRVV